MAAVAGDRDADVRAGERASLILLPPLWRATCWIQAPRDPGSMSPGPSETGNARPTEEVGAENTCQKQEWPAPKQTNPTAAARAAGPASRTACCASARAVAHG